MRARDAGPLSRHHRLRRGRAVLGGGRDGIESWRGGGPGRTCARNMPGWRRGKSGSPRRRSAWCWPCRQRTGGLQALCATFDVELTDIGAFTGDGRLRVSYGGAAGAGPGRMISAWRHAAAPADGAASAPAPQPEPGAAARRRDRLQIRRCCSICWRIPISPPKPAMIRIYDHEVQGRHGRQAAHRRGTTMAHRMPRVLQPLGTHGAARRLCCPTGSTPSLASSMPTAWPSRGRRGHAQRRGGGRRPGPHRAAGQLLLGRPAAGPTRWAALVEAARGCYDAALLFGAPFISGKDSLNNEYLRRRTAAAMPSRPRCSSPRSA